MPARSRLLLVGLAAAVTALHLALGPGWVLDDWFTLGNAELFGALDAAGPDQRTARPGAWLVYALVFGTLGDHPAVVVALMGCVVAATAVGLYELVGRFVEERLALAVAVVWVVLPNHTSLEVWASAANIGVALLLTVVGLLLLTGDEASAPVLVAAAALLAAATLSYEAIAPAASLGALALPWIRLGRPCWDRTGAAAVGIGGATLWVVTHWHPAKSDRGTADLFPALDAHFGWGVLPEGVVSDLGVLVVLVGLAIGLGGLIRGVGDREISWLLLAGLVVLAVGVLPFVRYVYQPLGAGDRLNVVSAIGGAMVWAGLVVWAHRVREPLGVLALVALLGLGAVERAGRSVRWHQAGDDAVTILDEVERRWPDPPTETVVLGPRAVVADNIAAFADGSNVSWALRVRYGTLDVRGEIGADDWAEADPDQRIDIVELSSLGE